MQKYKKNKTEISQVRFLTFFNRLEYIIVT